MPSTTSELTIRAVISGLFVGILICASNICIGLMIGWTFGASITAAVISFAIFRGFTHLKNPYTSKENLISATAGSSAGTMSSAGGFVAAIPALEMIRAQMGLPPLSYWSLVIWAISIAFLGVHFAVPLRKQMVVVEKLKYPTGTAAAETIKAMYASGAEALKKTKVLLTGAIVAAVFQLLFLTIWHLVETVSFDDFGLFDLAILGIPLYLLHLGINLQPMMLGAGILIGPRVGWSLFAGAIICWAIIVPIILNNGTVEVIPDLKLTEQAISALNVAEEAGDARRIAEARKNYRREVAEAIRRAESLAKRREVSAVDVLRSLNAPAEVLRDAGMMPEDETKPVPTLDLPTEKSPYRAGISWVLWTGVALMITSSFTSLALQYKTIARTFTSLRSAARSGEIKNEEEEEAPDPYPFKYWIIGMILATALTATLAKTFFGIPIWMGVLAVILSMFIAAIAVRATGETDINPVGAVGKITQVVYGALAPGKIMTNLMAAAITAAGASQSGDLMHDLKAGYMLKVSIRRQVITQLIGVVIGVFAAAGTFKILMTVYDIPGEKFPGPAVYVWYKMAEVLAIGFKALPAGAMWGAAAGAILGIILPLLGRIKAIGKWLPSPVAFGIAFIVNAHYSIGMWVGAMFAYAWAKRNKDQNERFAASLASGLIAGAGLMMVGYALFLMISKVLV